jgi:hypothetical protein
MKGGLEKYESHGLELAVFGLKLMRRKNFIIDNQ